jgi:anti-sigma regulatory factor (Ser/Thr protein kinase)
LCSGGGGLSAAVVTSGPSHHNLFAYEDDGALVERVAPFLADGLHEREAVVLVVDPRKRALLTAVLGELARRIDYVDRDSYYTRPEDALAGYDAQVRRYLARGFARVRVFGELPLCRTPQESDTWILYEALLNPAFAHHPVTIVCGLDAREQPDSVLEGSWATHPRTMNHSWADNDHYHDPRDVVRARAAVPRDAPGLTPLAETDARALRARLLHEMAAAGVGEADATSLIAAAGEVLANAHRHGGGVRALRLGRVGDRFVCEIADHGPGLDDPLAGYLPPRNGRGAGLWVARQLTRGLEMRSTERGLTTRLWI